LTDRLARALGHHQSGRLREAGALYREILAAHPDHPDALHYLGVLALQEGNAGEAVRLIERSFERAPGNVDALNNLGQAFASLGRWPDAAAAYRKALAKVPGFVPAQSNLGDALMELGEMEAAVVHYRMALEASSDDPEILINLGKALALLGRPEEATDCFRQILEVAPGDPVALTHLGVSLQAAGKLDEAIAALGRAIAVQPELFEAHYNLGMALFDQNQLEESIASYRRALVLDPDHVDAHYNLCLLFFLQGRLREGWEEYEWRWRYEGAPKLRLFPQALWQGGKLKGKTILVWFEQGVGDEILFASMVPDLMERGARVVLECDPRLIPVFSRSFPGVECLPKEDPPCRETQRKDIDLQVPGGDLGRWLRSDFESFQGPPSYLVADGERRDALRARYQDGGADLLVGLAWGSVNKRIGGDKSMPLAGFKPLTRIPGITFVDLQYGDTADERRAFEEETGISFLHDTAVDQLADLDIFTDQVAAMDLVVSVSNTTVHVSGGLGVPTWVLLNKVPLSCWMLKKNESPWYPSVRLFRQERDGDWTGVIARAQSELKRFMT